MKSFAAWCRACGRPWAVFTSALPDKPCPFCGTRDTVFRPAEAINTRLHARRDPMAPLAPGEWE